MSSILYYHRKFNEQIHLARLISDDILPFIHLYLLKEAIQLR